MADVRAWRPVDQTRFGNPDGNCLVACVASFFGCAIADLPDLADIEASGGDWWKAFSDVCVARDVRPIHAWASWFRTPPAGLHIVGGKSPRGDFDHAVLALDGVIVHDPHPSRAGLAGQIVDYYLMIPMVGS